jgi:hypothetical protein
MEKELRISRQLEKQGYILCRTRALHLADLGGYMLVDAATNAIVAGPRFDLTLDGAAGFIRHKRNRKAAMLYA